VSANGDKVEMREVYRRMRKISIAQQRGPLLQIDQSTSNLLLGRLAERCGASDDGHIEETLDGPSLCGGIEVA
jgi:hypothetical protein